MIDPASDQKQGSVLKALSAKNLVDTSTNTSANTSANTNTNTSSKTRLGTRIARSPTRNRTIISTFSTFSTISGNNTTGTSPNPILIGHQKFLDPVASVSVSRPSMFRENNSNTNSSSSNLPNHHNDRRFRSLNFSRTTSDTLSSGMYLRCVPTRSIVNRALEVMSNSLRDRDEDCDLSDGERVNRKEYSKCRSTSKSNYANAEFGRDGDAPTDSSSCFSFGGNDSSSSTSSSIENDNENCGSENYGSESTQRGEKDPGAAGAAPGAKGLTSQLSFRKIAKKRRKAAGRSSFHHTKSSKEYLRKAQEAYQRLKISEQQEQGEEGNHAASASARARTVAAPPQQLQHLQLQQQLQLQQLQQQPALDNSCHSESSCEEFALAANLYGYEDPDASATVSAEPETKATDEVVDYGYGDPSESEPTTAAAAAAAAIDYGYGDSAQSEPTTAAAIDYGYGDPDAMQQHQEPRRRGRARRRNSVTKFSVDAANVVAAKAAAARILQLGLNKSNNYNNDNSNIHGNKNQASGLAKNPDVGDHEPTTAATIIVERNTKETGSSEQQPQQQQQPQRQHRVHMNDDLRPAPPQRSTRNARDVFAYSSKIRKNATATKRSTESLSHSLSEEDPACPKHNLVVGANSKLKLTSDYFLAPSACAETNNNNNNNRRPSLLRKEGSGRSISSNNVSFRFLAPIRTDSWLSNNNNFDDDDDADSLASDLESLCSIRDGNNNNNNNNNNGSFRLDNSLTFRNADLPPVPPAPPQASPRVPTASSRRGSSCSAGGEPNMRKTLLVSFSNSSLTKSSERLGSGGEGVGDGIDVGIDPSSYPILPFAGTSTTTATTTTTTTSSSSTTTTTGRTGTKKTTATTSESCMPAPVNRTPSYNGSHHQHRKV